MQRYRKGQMFRPPTAMESAATADAVEAHRVRPSRPQDRSPVGQSMIVKTPEGGIPACGEDGVIPWVMCKRVIQRGGSGDREMALTDEQVPVYNILESPIPGDIYVATALTECGVRYVLPSVKPMPVVLNMSSLLTASGSGLSGHYCSESYPGTGVISPSEVTGDATAAGVEILTPTAKGDHCLKFLTAGTWRATLRMSLIKPHGLAAPSDGTPNTGSAGDPSHYHQYNKTSLLFPIMTVTAWAHIYNEAGDSVTANAGNVAMQVPFFICAGPVDGFISPPNEHMRIFEAEANQQILLEVQPRGYNTGTPEPTVEVYMGLTLEWLGPRQE